MNRICRRAIAAAGALALTGGTVLVSALPASAKSLPDNFSYGASADGFVNSDGLAEADDSFGDHVEQQSHFNFSHLVSGGEIVDTAFPGGATSSVAKVNVLGSLTVLGLTARVVQTSCSFHDGDPATGHTTIIGGLVGLGGFGEPVDPDPSVNETIHLPGATVILNHQVTDIGGDVTVDGMFIELPGGEDITVATSACEGDDL
jgi:hypothetical protein